MRYDGRLVFKHLDGSVELYGPGSPDTFVDGETETEFWQRIHDRTKAAVPHLATAEWVATIPSAEHIGKDRYFRGAWTWVTPEPVIDVDMTKAVEIHKAKLRELRAPKLAALDVEYTRADEAVDTATKAIIAGKKQALRDMTKSPALSAAKTPEQLKAVMPEALK